MTVLASGHVVDIEPSDIQSSALLLRVIKDVPDSDINLPLQPEATRLWKQQTANADMPSQILVDVIQVCTFGIFCAVVDLSCFAEC